MARSVSRIGDPDAVHCSPMVRAMGSPNTFVNGLSCQRIGDLNTVHTFPAGTKCPPHAQPIFAGGPTVFVNGLAIGHVGDPTCTVVVGGSPNVFAN